MGGKLQQLTKSFLGCFKNLTDAEAFIQGLKREDSVECSICKETVQDVKFKEFIFNFDDKGKIEDNPGLFGAVCQECFARDWQGKGESG